MKLHPALSLVLVLAACQKPATTAHHDEAPTAHFKAGHGVHLPDAMRKSLGIETVDVIEQKFTPRLEIPLHVLHPAEAGGWLTAAQAKEIHPGQPVKLLQPDGKTTEATVREIRKAPFAALGEFEIAVATPGDLLPGTALTAILESPPTAEVAAVPATAVMKTAEGEFVYVVNEDYFARTAVKTGARNADLVEIADGLYAGDQVVSAQVAPLWMTELQSIRAGQSCAHGH